MKRYIFILLLLIALPFRLYKIDQPLSNITNFRQAQTATIALNFYKNGINLFQTELDIFGKGKERYLTLEFPLYEAIVAIFYRLFFPADMWGRMVSVVTGLIGGFYLYRIVLLLTKNRTLAFFSCFFYFFAPLNMYHQRDFLIETTVVTFLLAGAYYFYDFILRGNKRSYIAAILLFSFGFVQKGMYGPFWFIPLTYLYIKKNSPKSLLSLQYIFITGIPLLSLYLWQKHEDSINILNGHEYFTSFNLGQILWNLGGLSDRFDFSLWSFRITNLINGIFLKPGLILFALGLLTGRKWRNKGFLYVWLFSEIIYFLTFFRIQSHIYYQIVIIPVVSIFMAVGLMKIGNLIYSSLMVLQISHPRGARPGHPRGVLGFANWRTIGIDKLSLRYFRQFFFAAFLSFFIWKSWLNSQWDASVDWQWYNRLQQVGRSVPANSYGIFVNPGYDWNSVYTYFPKLKMKLVGAELVTPENIDDWQKQGYTYIVLHEYGKYSLYLKELKSSNSLDFLRQYKEVLTLEDFKVYLLD